MRGLKILDILICLLVYFTKLFVHNKYRETIDSNQGWKFHLGDNSQVIEVSFSGLDYLTAQMEQVVHQDAVNAIIQREHNSLYFIS